MMSEADGPRPNIRHQFFWVFTGRVVGAVLQAGLLILLAALVSPADLGVVMTALSIVTVAQSGLDLGLPTLAAKERAGDHNSRVVAVALWLNSWTSFGLLLLLAATALLFGLFVDSRFLLLLPLALGAALERVADARLGVALADGDAWKNLIGMVSRRAVSLAAFAVLLGLVRIDATLAFATSTAVGAVAGAIYARASVRVSSTTTPSALEGFAAVRSARAYWVNSLAAQLRNLDVVIVAGVAGASQAGYYGLAARMAVPLRLPATSLGSVLLPASSRVANRDELLRVVRLAGGGWAALAFAYAVIIAAAPLLMSIAFDPSYEPAVIVVQLVLMALVFGAGSSMLSPILQGQEERRFVAFISVLTTAIALTAALFASLSYGAVGAAGALVLAYAFQLMMLVQRTLVVSKRWR